MSASSNAVVTVSLPGSATVTFELSSNGDVQNVADALRVAAEVNGTTVDPQRVSVVKNGEQVPVDAPVAAGDSIAAAGKVGNGSA